MHKELRRILEGPCERMSALTDVDIHSKRIDLLEHTLLLAECAINRTDLTDTAFVEKVSKSQLSKLNLTRSYQVFTGIFYDLLSTHIRSHNLHLYRRYTRILGIDSTFIRTSMKHAGKYRRSKTEEGIKMQTPALLYPLTLPMDALITPANNNDSPLFDQTIQDLIDVQGEDFLRSCILVFDLGYYDLERFTLLKLRGIPFVTRMKSNARYDVIREYAHSSIIRFGSGLELRYVTITVDGEDRNYLTDILDLPDVYIHWIYSLRWEIEIFFRTMKSLLRVDHLISRKLNGIMVQMFAFLCAYLALLMIQAMLPGWSLAEIIRSLRHGTSLHLRKNGNASRTLGIA